MTEVIEGTAVEIVPAEIRAVAVVQQPGQVIVSGSTDPADMVGVASRLATVLKDVVERQNLYTVIRGKKFPLVEAWMTIGRLDNVVAREARPPIRHEDGSYEAFAELVRLSDGMVIGGSSALCGTKGDDPWPGRAEPARRAMAQTRAISRAFRGQYSWIMALAGYEPTPAEEMPHEPAGATQTPFRPQVGLGMQVRDRPDVVAAPLPGTWTGTYATTDSADGQVRQEAERGHVLKFVVQKVEPRAFGRQRLNVRVYGPLAVAVDVALRTFGAPEEVIVWGDAREETFDKDGQKIAYAVCEATRVQARWTVPAEGVALPVAVSESEKVNDLDNLPW